MWSAAPETDERFRKVSLTSFIEFGPVYCDTGNARELTKHPYNGEEDEKRRSSHF